VGGEGVRARYIYIYIYINKRETFCFKSLDIYYITGNGDIQWCFSQVKGTLEDDVTEGEFDLCLHSEREREKERSTLSFISLNQNEINN